MTKLSSAHLEKRCQKNRLVLRNDIFCTYLQREMAPKDYFDLSFAYPKQADKVLIDGMNGGDWFSVYDSEILPLRRNPFLARFRSEGIDVFGEWVKYVHAQNQECWLADRISEVDLETESNFPAVKAEHPEWFLPAFGHKLNNLAIPEIREHKRRVLGEVMRKYPFDGLDVDFERHTPCLPVGHQWDLRDHVTEYMRMLRRELLTIAEEQNRVILLSARVPDCLKGCREYGLDIQTWIDEDLVDCLTLGSRSFDVKVEEFRALSDDIQLYACYDPHHTVDGYTFPPIETIRGICYSWLTRGADGIEYFNWSGEGEKELVSNYVTLYGAHPHRDNFVQYANDDFTGLNDREFLAKQDKTYVIDRKGGYPWGIGYGNLNADRQLPLDIETTGEVCLYAADQTCNCKTAVLRLLFEELTELPEIRFNGAPLQMTASPHRDLQVTSEAEAPTSGYYVSQRLIEGTDLSKPCTLLTADVTGIETKIGYNTVQVQTRTPVRLEKVELATTY